MSDSPGGRLRQAVHAASAPLRWLQVWRLRLNAWRRIRFTTGGLVFTVGTFTVGFAAMNTGNNLLYLLLGAMLGLITVSGWLSEQAIRDLQIERDPPPPVTVGQEIRLTYRLRNRKRRLPSLAVEIGERGLPHSAFLAHVPAMGEATARSLNRFERRGIFPLSTVTLSTGFPFGLFRKERDLEIPGEIVVWPRHGRPVRPPAASGGRVPERSMYAVGALGARGEFRSLRAYRPRDDPRDIHWRSTARLRQPVVREYERDGAQTRWICLDLRAELDEPAEVAVEVAASLAARAASEGRPFGLIAGDIVLDPGNGPRQLERVLDALARVDFSPDAAPPSSPVDPSQCVLVSVDGSPGFGDAFVVGRGARLEALSGVDGR